jgi:hypothetical protein
MMGLDYCFLAMNGGLYNVESIASAAVSLSVTVSPLSEASLRDAVGLPSPVCDPGELQPEAERNAQIVVRTVWEPG